MNVHLPRTIIWCFVWSIPALAARAQSPLTVKDAAEISYKSELLINEYRDLLNIISNTETNLKESKDLIYNSHSGARNKIFFSSTITVDDDLYPNEYKSSNHREIPIEKYLNDVDLLYQKSDTPSVEFANIRTSNVKKADYLYIKVFYSSQFHNKPVGNDTPFVINNRVAEIRVEKDKNKWMLQIMRLAFYKPADTVNDTKNDVALALNQDAGTPGAADSASSGASGASFADELRTQERARQVEEYKKVRDQYNKLIETGDQALQANDMTAALKAFTEAAELSPYEIYPKIKLNQIRKNVEQSAISDEELYKQYIQKGEIAEKERHYEQAKDDYSAALAKKPLEASTLEETIRRLTAKLHTMTELEEKYDAGQYKDAVKDYDRAIKKDNKNSDFFLGRGKCYDKLGDYSHTLKDYSTAIDLDNNNLQAWKLRAALYAGKGDYIKALGDYKICTTINKTDTGVWYKMSDLHVLTGNLSSAEDDLNKVIAIDPTIATVYYRKGMLFIRQANTAKGYENFSTAIRANNSYAQAYYQRGLCNVKMSRISQAGDDFANARQFGLDDASVKNVATIASQYYTSGVDQFNRHALDSSLHLINSSILIDPSVAEYRFKRGECYFFIKDYRSAITNYSDAILLRENYYDAYYKRGWSKFYLSSFHEAIPDLETATRISPKLPVTYKLLGDAFYMLAQYPQAVPEYEQALQTAKNNKVVLDDPLLTDLYNHEAEAYFRTNDFPKSLESAKNAVRYGKDNARAYFNRGNASLKLNEPKDAEVDLLKALSLQPGTPVWCFTLGEVYRQKSQWENAVGQYSQAISADTTGLVSQPAIYDRGLCYAQLSDYPHALSDYQTYRLLKKSAVQPKTFWVELGTIYLQMDKSDSAQSVFNSLLKVDSADAQAWYGMAIVYVQKNQFDQAMPCFEKAFGSGAIKYAVVKKDKLLASIRDDKRYKSLIKKYF